MNNKRLAWWLVVTMAMVMSMPISSSWAEDDDGGGGDAVEQNEPEKKPKKDKAPKEKKEKAAKEKKDKAPKEKKGKSDKPKKAPKPKHEKSNKSSNDKSKQGFSIESLDRVVSLNAEQKNQAEALLKSCQTQVTEKQARIKELKQQEGKAKEENNNDALKDLREQSKFAGNEIKQLEQDTRKQVLGLLSDSQRQAWSVHELTGKVIKAFGKAKLDDDQIQQIKSMVKQAVPAADQSVADHTLRLIATLLDEQQRAEMTNIKLTEQQRQQVDDAIIQAGRTLANRKLLSEGKLDDLSKRLIDQITSQVLSETQREALKGKGGGRESKGDGKSQHSGKSKSKAKAKDKSEAEAPGEQPL